MHFTRDIVLLCQAFGIATTMAAAAAKPGCSVPSSYLFTIHDQGQPSYGALAGSDEGAIISFFENNTGNSYHLASYKGTHCVLHDSAGRPAILNTPTGDTSIQLYKGGKVPSGASPVVCSLDNATSVISCSAGSSNVNNGQNQSGAFFWELVTATSDSPFTATFSPVATS